MSTPRDPNGGDTDWGRPPVGGWGAPAEAGTNGADDTSGTSDSRTVPHDAARSDSQRDPHADPPTPPFGIPIAGEDEPAGQDPDDTPTPPHGWDPAGRTLPAGEQQRFDTSDTADAGGSDTADAGGSDSADAGGSDSADAGGSDSADAGGWDPTGRTTPGGGSTGAWNTRRDAGEPDTSERTGSWSPDGTGTTGAWGPEGAGSAGARRPEEAGSAGAWGPEEAGSTRAWSPDGRGGTPAGGAEGTGAWNPEGSAGGWGSAEGPDGRDDTGALSSPSGASSPEADAGSWSHPGAGSAGAPEGAVAWSPQGRQGEAGPVPDGTATTEFAASGARGAGRTTTPSTPPGATATGSTRRQRRRSAGGRRRRGLLLGGIALVVVVAAVLVLGFWRPGFFVVDEFDQAALQAGVTQVLTGDYGLDATGVTCPEGQRVTPGTTFACSATVDGENVQVPVTVLDENGTYQVGRV